MQVINVTLPMLKCKKLVIGFVGENQRTQVRIDASPIFAEYPSATPSLTVRPVLSAAYPALVERDEDEVVWDIVAGNLAINGDAEMQLTFQMGDVICKTCIGKIHVKRSLGVSAEMPDPVVLWVDAATAKLNEVDAQIDELEGMVHAAEAARDTAQSVVDGATAGIQAAGQTQVSNINAAGATHVGNVNAAGATQVGNVNTAGSTQVSEVQAKGTEVLNSIPSDYTALSESVPKKRITTETTNDLDVADNIGNSILRLRNGHIQVKYFSSTNAVQKQVTDADDYVDFVDSAGNVMLRLADGHIQIKKFSSKDIVERLVKLEENVAKPWIGKKWTVVGDSLTEVNSRTTMHYHDYISEKTGISVVNLGMSGTGYKRAYAQNPNYRPFWERITDVPTDSDVITIFGGANDVYEGYTLGDITDTGTNTIMGAVNTTLDNLYSHMPLANLGIITAIPWYLTSSSRDLTPGNPGNALEQFCEAMVALCARRSIPCLDLYHCANLRTADSGFRALAFSKDDGNGMHPDETGHALIAARIYEFVKLLMI